MIGRPENNELEELLDGYCSATLTEEQRTRLEDALRTSAAARVEYLRYMTVHAGLRSLYRGAQPAPAELVEVAAMSEVSGRPIALEPAMRTIPFLRRSLVWVATAAALILAVTLLRPFGRDHGPQAPPQPPLARVLGEHEAQWSTAGGRPSANDDLSAGVYILESGLSEGRLASGVTLVVEGPAEWELIDVERVFLRSGSIVARMGEQKVRFAIVTEEAQLHDLGTEFGVSVGPAGDTLVQVYDGRVLAESRSAGAARESRLLGEGESLRIAPQSAGNAVDVRFVPQRFVRQLPDIKHGGRANHNIPSLEAVRVLPIVRPPEIDGRLDDWDWKAAFRAACLPPFAASHAVEGAMRYDEAGLYLAARVKDPFPLRNVTNPETDAELGWRGGGLQVRLCLDRKLAWPVNQVNPRLSTARRPRPVEPEPTSSEADPKTVHLTLWNYAPRNEPCLHVHYGMTYRDSTTNPPGFRGAFQPAAGGQGYTLEYFIPWEVLHVADHPPRGGDVLAANWTVHWSGPDGRLWRGQLIEICNPEHASQIGKPQIEYAVYNRTIFWGRAEFQAP